jgi:hypothetical protein
LLGLLYRAVKLGSDIAYPVLLSAADYEMSLVYLSGLQGITQGYVRVVIDGMPYRHAGLFTVQKEEFTWRFTT